MVIEFGTYARTIEIGMRVALIPQVSVLHAFVHDKDRCCTSHGVARIPQPERSRCWHHER